MSYLISYPIDHYLNCAEAIVYFRLASDLKDYMFPETDYYKNTGG